jgi:hypothetical protein
MIWSQTPIFQAGARFVCPTMELFHIYKKGIEVLWREPIFFFPFIAPLMHRFYPQSKVLPKPKLKQMEIVFTALILIYPEIRERVIALQDRQAEMEEKEKNHLRNLIFLFEFALPIVCMSFFFRY